MSCLKMAMGLVLVTATFVANADDSVRFSLNKSAPKWTALPGTDGKPHSWQEYQDAKATVVVFLCNHAPARNPTKSDSFVSPMNTKRREFA